MDPLNVEQASAAFQYEICDVTVWHCTAQYGNGLQAIILTGSMARNESTFLEQSGNCYFQSDVEFLMIFSDQAALPPDIKIEHLRHAIENELLFQRIHCQIHLSTAHTSYLRDIKPHIFGYELKECGQVVWGKPEMLALIPRFSPVDIPREDAWCLLSNRIVEHLEALVCVADMHGTLPPSLQYNTIKLCLDMATSYLVFAGAYAPTYSLRQKALLSQATETNNDPGAPFPLEPFARQVAEFTKWKLHSAAPEAGVDWETWKRVVSQAQQLWYWELRVLTGASTRTTDQQLRELWMSRQPLMRRLRGWASVLRKKGWSGDWRQWQGFFKKARQSSPRYGVYLVADELFRQFPALLTNDTFTAEQSIKFRECIELLPEHPSCEPPPMANWRVLATEVSRNYHLYLEGTRA